MDKKQEIRMLKTMIRIRTLEDKLEKLFREGRLNGHLHTYHGQEAIAVGTMEALSDKDIIFSNHRNHGHFLARGTSPQSIISECCGKITGTNKGRSGSMYLSDKKRGLAVASGVVGGNICVATGSALASQIKKDHAVTISFFGDGATNIGFFHESLNMAAVWNLPIIYICENNHYGAATKKEEHQKIINISERATAYSIPGYNVDGTDVVKVYHTVKQVVKKARDDGGPALLEFVVFRLRGHSAGDLGIYRPDGEQEEWMTLHDPIKKFKKKLLNRKVIDIQEIENIETEAEKETEEGVKFARGSEYPLSGTVADFVYREEEANE